MFEDSRGRSGRRVFARSVLRVSHNNFCFAIRTSGFDDRGRQFDKVGNIVNWWEPETDVQFRQRAQCIINQYGNYTFPDTGLKVPR